MKVQVNAGRALTALGHLAAIVALTLASLFIVVPYKHAKGVASVLQGVPAILDMSVLGIGIHVGLSACLWALLCIVAALVRLRIAEHKSVAVVRRTRGSVITETLIVMPVFLLMMFGMAQLAINNITGILANVAAYEAARAAWVWQPESDASAKRLGVTTETAGDMCRIAVAMVMLPVAPGEYKQDTDLSDRANRARMMALGANVPGGGMLVTALPSVVPLAETAVSAFSDTGTKAVQGNLYLPSALDHSSFMVRTIRKFTQAYHGAKCVIAEDHSVTMTYKHQAVMPVVGGIFGDHETVAGREGFFATFTRQFGFRKQHNTPNKQLPQNRGNDEPSPEEPSFDARGAVESEAGVDE